MTYQPTKLERDAEALTPMTDEQFKIAQHMLDWVRECIEDAAQTELTSPSGRKEMAAAFRYISDHLFGDAGGHPEFVRRYKGLIQEIKEWQIRTDAPVADILTDTGYPGERR